MIGRRITRPCVIHRATTLPVGDGMGDPAPGPPGDVPSVCEIQEVQTLELRDRQYVVVSTWRVFFRAGTPIKAVDTFTVDGITYSIQGDPWPVRHPRRGVILHIEARAKAVA